MEEINSLFAIAIIIFSVLIVTHFVNKIDFTSSGIKLYFTRAGIGIIPVFLLSTTLYFLMNSLLLKFF